MEIQINDCTIKHEFDENLPLGTIIQSITEDLKAEEKVICQIEVDSTIIPEEQEQEAFKQKINSIKTLKLMADHVDNLVINSLKSLKNLLPELVRVLTESANYFRTGENGKANKQTQQPLYRVRRR